ncbi:hypothetical protein ABZT51_48870, partial [Streptomyces sp. NPDC005373]|uniref:hypothetical protein n=1 Tax=Streptomyces sp. NPDC005373 TaxID=3156879 RepID=UPI0033A026ED
KHGGANAGASVRLVYFDDGLGLLVEDDGTPAACSGTVIVYRLTFRHHSAHHSQSTRAVNTFVNNRADTARANPGLAVRLIDAPEPPRTVSHQHETAGV